MRLQRAAHERLGVDADDGAAGGELHNQVEVLAAGVVNDLVERNGVLVADLFHHGNLVVDAAEDKLLLLLGGALPLLATACLVLFLLLLVLRGFELPQHRTAEASFGNYLHRKGLAVLIGDQLHLSLRPPPNRLDDSVLIDRVEA